MTAPSPRQLFLLSLLFIAGVYGYALYTQYVDGLEPCPLCMSQRAFYLLTGLFALIGVLHLGGRRVYGALMALAALAGGAVAARQVWLQHLPPDKVPACGPSVEFMVQTLPFRDLLVRMLTGDGNCAEIDWSFLGLSMAAWSLICFLLLAVAGLWQLLRRR